MLTFVPAGPSLEARILEDSCLSVCLSDFSTSCAGIETCPEPNDPVEVLFMVCDPERASTLTKATPAGGRGPAMLARLSSPASV